MKKLQIKTPDGWKYVFCCAGDRVVTLGDHEKAKALPTRACWGKNDLTFFSNKFGNSDFRLA